MPTVYKRHTDISREHRTILDEFRHELWPDQPGAEHDPGTPEMAQCLERFMCRTDTITTEAVIHKALRQLRKSGGTGSSCRQSYEWLYLVCMDPNARPARLKMGKTTNIEQRLKGFVTTSPDTKLLAKNEVPAGHESTARAHVLRHACGISCGRETADYRDPDKAIQVFNEYCTDAIKLQVVHET